MGVFNRIVTALSPTDSAAMVRAAKDFLAATASGRAERRHAFESAFRFVFDGVQWTSAELSSREGNSSLVFNLSEDYVDRYLGKLFPVNPRTQVLEVGVKLYEPDVERRSLYEQEISDIYKRSSLSSILLEQGQNFLVGGSAVLYFPQDPVTLRGTLRGLSPVDCSFLFDSSGISAAAHVERFHDDRSQLVERLTYWTRDAFVIIENDKAVKFGANDSHIVPYVFIPNRPKPGTMNGRPKLSSVRDLERDLNLRASDWSQRTGENTEPHMVISTDKIKRGDEAVRRGRKKITTVEKGGEAKYLTVPDADDIESYVLFLRDMIKTKLSLVDSAGTISSGVSGVSLAYQYSDMLDQVSYMRVFWDSAFRAINRAFLIYRFGVMDGGDYHTDPVYHPALVQDTKAKVEELLLMVEAGLISRRDAIEELRGSEDADEKLTQILKERDLFESQKNVTLDT